MQMPNDCVRLTLFILVRMVRLEWLELRWSRCEVELWQALAHEGRLFHQSIDKRCITNCAQTRPHSDTGGCLQGGPCDICSTYLALLGKLYCYFFRHIFEFSHLNGTVGEPALAELLAVALIIKQAEQSVDQQCHTLMISLLKHLGVDGHSCTFLEMVKVDLK